MILPHPAPTLKQNIEAGKTWQHVFYLRDKATQTTTDLSNINAARLTLREVPTATTALVSLTLGSGITVDTTSSPHTVTVQISDVQSAALQNIESCGGDLELVSTDGTVGCPIRYAFKTNQETSY